MRNYMMTCKIRDILKDQTPQVSFEIFPPKTDAGYDSVLSAAEKIAALKPSFISVTYGAGGGTSKNTVSIASQDVYKRQLQPLKSEEPVHGMSRLKISMTVSCKWQICRASSRNTLPDSIPQKQKASGKNIRKVIIRWTPIIACSI